jgi:putative hemolysin
LRTPILPIHIDGRNSNIFYLVSLVLKPLSTMMLVHEMFRKKRKNITITVGEIIPHTSYNTANICQAEKVKLLRKHLYRIGTNKTPPFLTESAIAHPERRAELKKAIHKGQLLGVTPDKKNIYLFNEGNSSTVMREIGRLREQAYRAVGEGTGNRRDLDRFDMYYRHLVLWDEEELEIAGAYRFVDSHKVVREMGTQGLYSGSLFKLDAKKCSFLNRGLELGRSFVQQRYWGKRSLDYLWYGLGAFLVKNPDYRYLFGPVSISNSMPTLAKELLIYFYTLYFPSQIDTSCSRNPFTFSQPLSQLKPVFSGNNYKTDFKKLKSLLANLKTAVPPLYKQYAELCEPGGVSFLDFNIDPAFNNCVDGLVIVDTDKLKPKKRKRYLEETILK